MWLYSYGRRWYTKANINFDLNNLGVNFFHCPYSPILSISRKRSLCNPPKVCNWEDTNQPQRCPHAVDCGQQTNEQICNSPRYNNLVLSSNHHCHCIFLSVLHRKWSRLKSSLYPREMLTFILNWSLIINPIGVFLLKKPGAVTHQQLSLGSHRVKLTVITIADVVKRCQFTIGWWWIYQQDIFVKGRIHTILVQQWGLAGSTEFQRVDTCDWSNIVLGLCLPLREYLFLWIWHIMAKMMMLMCHRCHYHNSNPPTSQFKLMRLSEATWQVHIYYICCKGRRMIRAPRGNVCSNL